LRGKSFHFVGAFWAIMNAFIRCPLWRQPVVSCNWRY